MFINRQRELGFLQDRKKGKKSEFIVIYGKRRVGKTELVKQFFKDIRHVYFLADKTSEHDQLKIFSEKIALFFKDNFLVSRGFGSWGECFAYLEKKGPLVLAIDDESGTLKRPVGSWRIPIDDFMVSDIRSFQTF